MAILKSNENIGEGEIFYLIFGKGEGQRRRIKANGSATERAVFEIAFWSKLVFEHLCLASPYHICNSHQQAENLSPKEAVSLALDKRKGGVGRFS